jgi:membrane dipeptidase
MNLIFDAHQDLAYNILSFGRDYSRSVYQTRQYEIDHTIPGLTYQSLLGWPEYNRGKVALIFGTLFASPARSEKEPYPNSQIYHTPEQANQVYWNQLKLYHHLAEEKPQVFRLISTRSNLKSHLREWENLPLDPKPEEYLPLGIIPSMEGAEGIVDFKELPLWWEKGLRSIGLAWAGNQFCGGTREPGPLTTLGRELLREMAQTGFILDLSHMDEPAALECIQSYPGQIIASHSNVASLVKGYFTNRLLSDQVLKELLARGGVIGVVPANAFLNWEWRADGGKAAVSLRLVAEQIDHICQIAGNCDQVGIGSDFDGGFGVEHVPKEIDSIADLQKLTPFLQELGYNDKDISRIFADNFLKVLESVLPE